ncbi:kinesin-like protein KIF26B [Myotis yumanensis]
MGFNVKLRTLERRQQRIAEVRAKYEWLMQELEATKQHLMLDPDQWLSEFDLEQVWELDSLEYLEALECVTERLESRVNFCKAHLMMITCFDITSRRRSGANTGHAWEERTMGGQGKWKPRETEKALEELSRTCLSIRTAGKRDLPRALVW